MEEQWGIDRIQPQPLFSPVEIDVAIKLAQAVDPDEPQGVETVGQCVKHECFGPDTYAHVLKGKKFIDCRFCGMSISGTNVSSAILENCSLGQCEIVNSNLKCSDFSRSRLQLSGVSSSFDSSDFSCATIRDSHLEGCSFSESYFWGAEIQNSAFIDSEFTSAVFLRTSIENVDMSRANLEYSEFGQTEFMNVSLPYWGILHITKGFSEILLVPDVWFVTPDGAHRVKRDQYLEEMSLLRPYLYYKKDFLALANLYIFDGDNTNAYYAILCGIEHAISIGNLKLMRNLCRLASLNSFFPKAQMYEFYQRIEASLANTNLSPMQYKNYTQELDLAKHFLIDCPLDQDSISITVCTSIPSTNYQRLSAMLRTLDTVIAETAPMAVSHMEVRHNSPIEIVVQVSGALVQLLTVFAVLDLIFEKTTSYIERIQNIILNHKKIRKTQEDQDVIEQLEKQIIEMKETIRKMEEQPAASNASTLLADPEEIRRISYVLSAKQLPVEELRTFCVSKSS